MVSGKPAPLQYEVICRLSFNGLLKQPAYLREIKENIVKNPVFLAPLKQIAIDLFGLHWHDWSIK